MEDYGDFKDSDEEVEKKFYYDYSQGDLEVDVVGESFLSFCSRISLVRLEQFGSVEFSGIVVNMF